MATSTSVSYKYILTDLLSNKVIAEVPFIGVSYGRAIKASGRFSGSIAINADTEHLDLYKNTMPGRTGIYVLRNDVCVWGGIIWSRRYDAKSRQLSVDGSEIISYFQHRKIWKTFNTSYSATLVVPTTEGSDATVTLNDGATFKFEAGSDVYLSFTGDYINLSSFFEVRPRPSTNTFQVLPSKRSVVVSRVRLKKGKAKFTTKTTHGLMKGDSVTVSGVKLDKKKYPAANKRFNTTQTVTKILSNYQFQSKIDLDDDIRTPDSGVKQTARATYNGSLPHGTYQITVECSLDTYEYARRLIDGIATDFGGIEYPNSAIQPGISYSLDIIGYGRQGNVVTVKTDEPHLLSEGQKFTIQSLTPDVNGTYPILEIIDEETVSFYSEGNAVPFRDVTERFATIVNRSRVNKTVTMRTATEHGFQTGDVVTITDMVNTKSKDEKVTYVYNGIHTVVDASSTTEFGINIPIQKDPLTFATKNTPIGLATVYPTLKVGSYGPFGSNSDIGIGFTDQYSGIHRKPDPIRPDEMKTLGDILDIHSDEIDGFDYRIDCDYDPDSGSFTRTFVFIPRNFPDPPATDEVSPITRFGAEKNVFEFPGNINTVDLNENAENASTRFFTIGSKEGLGDAAVAPHAAASAEDMLKDGWLLLDDDEKVDKEAEELRLYEWAYKYLREGRPPMGEMSLTVNGSIDPVIGSYSPGDWCSVIIDDPFFRQRLSSGLEPRDNIIIRKIYSYDVRVKDALGVPEDVSITLVPDWEVDTFAE
jgi:hypothetical protein